MPMTCTAKCWTPVPCPECGVPMPPRGRSVPLPMHVCDHAAVHDSISNLRHLWDEHDSDRGVLDPVGWAEHVAACLECRGDDTCGNCGFSNGEHLAGDCPGPVLA
jgi:hypothetical protein